MILWAKAVRIFHFRAHDVNKSLRHIVVPYNICDFNELVHWKRNLFNLPKGTPGKAFINELTKRINEWCSKSPNRDICLKALVVMPSLILQRTSNKCKMSEIKSHVERG